MHIRWRRRVASVSENGVVHGSWEYIHIIHRLVHPLPRVTAPIYRHLFLTSEG